MTTVQLEKCRIEQSASGIVRTVFSDGTEWSAFAHHEPHYYVISHRCGYGDDLDRYCFEHEVAHAFLWQEDFGFGPFSVIEALARGFAPLPTLAATEEAMVHTFQRWVRANERPIIGGVDWDDLKARFVALVDMS